MITKKAPTVLPDPAGEFGLTLFTDEESGKEYLAAILGQPRGRENILCRIHTQCFSGDVLHSSRCNCHHRLHLSMELIKRQQTGILIYLRQDGLAAELAKKPDSSRRREGIDLTDHNTMNIPADEVRTCDYAVTILESLDVKSVRLLTDNPRTVEQLQKRGIPVTEHVPLRTSAPAFNDQALPAGSSFFHPPNNPIRENTTEPETLLEDQVLENIRDMLVQSSRNGRDYQPVITASYAQSLDGSITLQAGTQYQISGRQSLRITHGLRAMHDAILIGVGTVLADDPLLTTRLTNGEDPKPIIVDSHLRMPLQCNLLRNNQVNPLVATTEFAEEQALNDLQSMGAEILITAATQDRRVDLGALLRKLYERNLKTVMVEGGSQILTSFFNEQLVNLLVLTIAPQILGGLPGIRELTPDPEGARPSLREVRHALIGKDLMVWGAIHWSTS